MKRRLRLTAGGALIAAGLGMALIATSDGAVANLGKVLYGFTGSPGPATPNGDLIMDAAGIVYGTSRSGGSVNSNCSSGCGTVYKVENGQVSVLYAFTGGADGSGPVDGLLLDGEGNLYGATSGGGDNAQGTVFMIAPDGDLGRRGHYLRHRAIPGPPQFRACLPIEPARPVHRSL